MSVKEIKGTIRKPGRKGPARALRRAGMLPGVVYGKGENVSVTVSSKDILKTLAEKGGANSVLLTKFDDDKKERHVMIKSLDAHPITDTLIHIDFYEVDMNKSMQALVGLEFSGIPKGVKEKGGVLNVLLNKLMVESMPSDIPASIPLDITEIDLGESLRVEDIKLSAGVNVVEDPKAVVVSVVAPKMESKEEEEDEATAESSGEAKPAEGDSKAPAGD